MNLKHYMDRHRLSLRAIASAVGVAPSTVSRWRRGQVPDLRYIEPIARATGGQVTLKDFTKKRRTI